MDENLEKDESVVEEVVEEKQQSQGSSEIEQQAREQGWVPEDEYTGDKSKWVDAQEFVRRGPLYKRIDSQSRELKALRQAIADIQALHAKDREVQYKKALAEVRAEKKAALIDGDADAVIEADEKMDMLREAQKENVAPVQTVDEPHPEFVNWVNRNPWYEDHKGMRAFADTVGIEFRKQGMSPADVLKAVEKEVRKEFPNRFVNPNQNKANAVEGSGTVRGSAKGDSFQLTDMERKAMNNFIRLGILTKEQYLEELKRTNG